MNWPFSDITPETISRWATKGRWDKIALASRTAIALGTTYTDADHLIEDLQSGKLSHAQLEMMVNKVQIKPDLLQQLKQRATTDKPKTRAEKPPERPSDLHQQITEIAAKLKAPILNAITLQNKALGAILTQQWQKAEQDILPRIPNGIAPGPRLTRTELVKAVKQDTVHYFIHWVLTHRKELGLTEPLEGAKRKVNRTYLEELHGVLIRATQHLDIK